MVREPFLFRSVLPPSPLPLSTAVSVSGSEESTGGAGAWREGEGRKGTADDHLESLIIKQEMYI